MKKPSFYTICALVFLSVLLPGPAYQPVSPDWQLELVDQSAEEWGGFWSTSLVLDADGHPHISYCGAGKKDERGFDELRYAYSDGVAWQVTRVDNNGCAASSLQLDSAGYPRISYSDGPNGHLKYAYYDGTSWQTETVDDSGEVYYATVLALNARDEPRIAYTGGYGLKYASKEGFAWTLETVAGRGISPMSISMDLDSSGYPHISYAVTSGYSLTELRYTWFDGSNWQSTVIDQEGMVGGYSSLVLDPLDRSRISYCTVDPPTGICSALKYAYQDNGSWAIETVDDTSFAGEFPSLRLDVAAEPHLSYCLAEQLGCAELRYSWRKNGVWHAEKVASSVGNESSLALGTDGQPHISYSDSGTLKYASRVQALLPSAGQPFPWRAVVFAAIILLELGLVLRSLAGKRAS